MGNMELLQKDINLIKLMDIIKSIPIRIFNTAIFLGVVIVVNVIASATGLDRGLGLLVSLAIALFAFWIVREIIFDRTGI